MFKLIKLSSLTSLFFMGIANASEVMSRSVNPVQNMTPEIMTKMDIFLYLLFLFISNTVLAFIGTWLFPKFFDNTVRVVSNNKRFKILLNGILAFMGILFVGSVALISKVGFTFSLTVFSLLFVLYFVGLSVFSMSLLNFIFKSKGIKFLTISKVNKFISLAYSNLCLLLMVLPFAIFIPTYKIIRNGELLGEINLPINLFVFLFSAFGAGMLIIHIKELLKKHKAKL